MFDLGDLRAGAERVLREAREEAARIVANARADADRQRVDGRSEGHARGLAEGRVEGLTAGRIEGEAVGRAAAAAAHNTALTTIEEMFAAEFLRWNAQRDEVMRNAERELAAIAVAIAERVVREHVRHDPSVVVREVEAAVSLFSRATRVSIEISPDDEALVSEAMPSLRAALPMGAEVTLSARAGIERGGCVIRSSEGSVDARMETQFRRMREGIVGDGPGIGSSVGGARDPKADIAVVERAPIAETPDTTASTTEGES